jgi:hypothetical protein
MQLLHGDRKTPWPGTHYFLYIPDRIAAFSPEHSRRYEPKRFEDQSHTGTIPFDIADGDISVLAEALSGQDMWQDNSLLWSLFFTDRALEAIRQAGLIGDMQVTRCPVVKCSAHTEIPRSVRVMRSILMVFWLPKAFRH